jgi:aminocarboxymuconate-semialdehyde decarboxylase
MSAENDSIFSIDIHTHIIPENMPDWKQKFGYGEFVSLEHHKPCCAKMMMDGEFFQRDRKQLLGS